MKSDALRLAFCLWFGIHIHVSCALAAEPRTYQPIDWNGDGVLDLADMSSDRQSPSVLHVYPGIAGSKSPEFSAPLKVAIQGDVTVRLTARSFADWNGDGDVDLLGCAENQVWVWENTAGKAASIRLDVPRKVLALGPSDIRQELSRFNPPAAFQCQAITAADWEGDGDQDLLVVMASGDGDLAVFELLERSAETAPGAARYAPPAAIRDDRGLPVMSSAGLAVRSILYLDWDRDGDLDLLYYDTTTRPSAGGGWLMYVENDNTRQKPLFIRPFTILPIAGAPFHSDWNGDGQVDLVAGTELFTNVNPNSSTRLPLEPALRPGGSRRPHPWTLPRFESNGPASLPAGSDGPHRK